MVVLINVHARHDHFSMPVLLRKKTQPEESPASRAARGRRRPHTRHPRKGGASVLHALAVSLDGHGFCFVGVR